jgi:hypothetical protein
MRTTGSKMEENNKLPLKVIDKIQKYKNYTYELDFINAVIKSNPDAMKNIIIYIL